MIKVEETLPVFLIEKNSLLKEGLKSLLAKTKFRVTVDCPDADSLEEYPPDISPCMVIVGIHGRCSEECPEERRVERKIAGIKNLFPEARIVVLAEKLEMCCYTQAFFAGADGFIHRDINLEALPDYLNLIMMGEKIFPADPSLYKDFKSHRAADPPVHVNDSLSHREIEIITCLTRGESNKKIAQTLGIAEATVKAHLKTILRKTSNANRTQLALWGADHGMAHNENQPDPPEDTAETKRHG